MCGIAGIYLKDPSIEIDMDLALDSLLGEIDHRGGDACGFVALSDEYTEWQKASCRADKFIRNRRPVPKGTRTMIAHTRWATQGHESFPENNHPIKRGRFFIIHNGHITNDTELFMRSGRQRYGQVDSESVAALLSSKDDLEGLPLVMEAVRGAAAIAAVDETRPWTLALARGESSPLYFLETKKMVIFGSTEGCVQRTHERIMGKVPKKKVKSMKQGEFVLYDMGERCLEQTFALPPQPVYHHGYSMADLNKGFSFSPSKWLSKTDRQKNKQSWEDDQVDCDSCGTIMPWGEAYYISDVDNLTWCLCDECEAVEGPSLRAETEQAALDREYEAEVSEEQEIVNAQILRDIEDRIDRVLDA